MTPDATRCVGPSCQEEGVIGLNGAWLCLTHFQAKKRRRARASSQGVA